MRSSLGAAPVSGVRAPARFDLGDRLGWNVFVPVLTAVAAVIVGYGVSTGSTKIVAAPIALFGFLVISATTWMPYAVVLLVAATFAEPYAYPQLSFAGINPFLSELVLGLAIVAALYTAFGRRFSTTAAAAGSKVVSTSLAVYLVAALLGIGVGLSNGVKLFGTLTQVRETAFFATFWLALLALRTPSSRARLFWIMATLSVAVVALQVAQVLIGPGHVLFYTKDPTINLITCPTGQCADVAQAGFSGLIRVRPPGLPLVYVVAAFAACYVLFGPRKRRGAALTLFFVCLAGLVVSLTRDLLIGLVLGLAVAFFISPRKSRLLAALIGVAAVVVALVVVSQGGALHSAKPVLSRFSTVTNPSAVRSEASLKHRSFENHLAFQAIRASPIEGIGWGTSYGMTEPVVVRGQTIGQADQPFIHNFYLGLWMRTGLLGLVAYLTAVIAAFVYGVRWCRRRRWDDQSWLGAAVVSSIVAVSTSAVVNVGSDAQKIVPFMVVLALAVTLRRGLPEARASTDRG